MAHRGWSSRAPENTLAAIQLAAQEDRIDSIEMDVQLSKDGVPIIFHDFSVERTTNGTGLVKDFTFRELQQLDAGSWFSSRFKGERVPSLEEVFIELKGKQTMVNLEIKTAGEMYPGIENKVVSLIEQLRMEDVVTLTSFDHQVIYRVKMLAPNVETGLLFYGNPTLVNEQLAYTGSTVVSIAHEFLTKEFVAKRDASKIIAWTVNTKEEVDAVKRLSNEIVICSNYPELLFT